MSASKFPTFETSSFEEIISENPITVFSVTYCPHCDMAKETLRMRDSYVCEVNQIENEKEMR
jgi:hypothetical protein